MNNDNLDWVQPDWDINSTTNNITWTSWDIPVLIKTTEVGETVEMLYKETNMFTYTTPYVSLPQQRVFKIVYSCKDGKWHKSERIYGEIIPAQEETYEFDK